MVQLTSAGRKAIEEAAPEHVENVQRYFDLVSKDEVRILAVIFNRLLENFTLEQAKAQALPTASP
jgi:DNA-binding MarR family transcriptional regulator